ncbi:hypothetical protein GQ43DRAFT_475827 [Delitschia confertaspora ATCC 74209]|uniref:PIN domain-containing protein n=1 Tax=Delitschia confertaspora ATCC 74209 TaxID=1513339 RepID=A0A9P4JHX7_9PLEO|nr:hypothetical protein GQ43DRAFT_475827 [Delitschia confertaspora ATCC 74209]
MAMRRRNHIAQRAPVPELPSRKVFNCIVDDTALIAGVKKSTRDGIRKWVEHGAIRLFVPLHTLSQLVRLKEGNERINADAREAVKWLDLITSDPAITSSGRVQLQGGDEQFATWAEVEKFLLPQTLLSMEESESEDEYLEDMESSFNNLDVSDGTSMSSSHSEDRPKTPASPKSSLSSTGLKVNGISPKKNKPSLVSIESPKVTPRNSADFSSKRKSPKSTVPIYLQPLFNHILWRIHQEDNADTALESFILLTNDPTKQHIAQRFGIRAKRLEQLRDAVGREDREFKNRMALYKMENGITEPTNGERLTEQLHAPATSPIEDDNSDEDVVLLKRSPRGPPTAPVQRTPIVPRATPAQRSPVVSQASPARVLDPHEFGRANQNRGGRGGRGAPGGFRGRGGRGSRGTYVARGAYVPPVSHRTPLEPVFDPSQPMDPDSYARPPPKTNTLRGGRRKLWEPN